MKGRPGRRRMDLLTVVILDTTVARLLAAAVRTRSLGLSPTPAMLEAEQEFLCIVAGHGAAEVPQLPPVQGPGGSSTRGTETTRTTAVRWSVSDRHVRALARAGRIPGAHQTRGRWRIPAGALRTDITAP